MSEGFGLEKEVGFQDLAASIGIEFGRQGTVKGF